MNLTIRIFMVDYLCQPVDSANILLRGVKSTLANGNRNHIKWDDRQEQQLRSFLCIYVRACVLTANFFFVLSSPARLPARQTSSPSPNNSNMLLRPTYVPPIFIFETVHIFDDNRSIRVPT